MTINELINALTEIKKHVSGHADIVFNADGDWFTALEGDIHVVDGNEEEMTSDCVAIFLHNELEDDDPETEMKPMHYGSGQTELLYTESENDYSLAVLNIRGSHICAYVQFPGVEQFENYDDAYGVGVHGGFTFFGSLERVGLKGNWLGWDYSHCDDYVYNPYGSWEGKRWTTEEVVEEAREALRDIKDGNLVYHEWEW